MPDLTREEFDAVVQRALESAPAGLDRAAFDRYVDGEVDKAVAAKDAPQSSLGTRIWEAAQGAGRTMTDASVGAAKGLGNTLLSTYELAAKYVPPLPGQDPAMRDQLIAGVESLKKEYTTPTNTAQSVGFLGEQIAETIIPGSKLSKLGQAISAGKNAGRVMRAGAAAGRIGLEGAGGAVMSAMQGQDPTVGGGVAALTHGVSTGVGALAPKATAAAKAGAEFAERHGIPISAAMATGSKAVERLQKTAEYVSYPTMAVAERVGRARDAALRRVGSGLSRLVGPGGKDLEGVGGVLQDEAQRFISGGQQQIGTRLHPTAVTAADAGTALDRGISQTAADAKAAAKVKYGEFEALADADAATRRATAEAGGGRIFKDHDLNKTKMFREVWRDAWANGYRGQPKELRDVWEARLQEAQSFLKERNAQNQGKVFLDFVSQSGGVGRADDVLQGELDRLWENSTAARRATKKADGTFRKQQFRNQGAMGNVAGVVKQGGLSPAEMMERLRNDPEVSAMWGITAETPDTALFDLMEEAAGMADTVKPMGVGEVLAQQGVVPGRLWWQDAASHGVPLEDIAAAGGKGGARAADGMPGGLMVSIKDTKQRLRDLYEEVSGGLPPANRDADQGLYQIQRILDLPDDLPASKWEDRISELKAVIRAGKKSPTWSNRTVGLSSVALSAAERDMKAGLAAHPQAAQALHDARLLTRQQHQANLVQDVIAPRTMSTRGAEIAPEGQTIYGQFATKGEANLERLRAVQRTAPAEVPKLARAIFDDIVDNGKWELWTKMGDQKKLILFGTPKQVKAVDGYMRRAEQLSMLTKGRDGVLKPGELVDNMLAHPERLRDIRKQAPDLGRAVLDDIFGKIESAAETRGGQLKAVKSWANLPEKTRTILVPDPMVRGEIDQLFKLWQQSLERAPQQASRFATTVVPGFGGGAGGVAYMLGSLPSVLGTGAGLAGVGWGMGELLHNPKARKLLLKIGAAGDKVSGAQMGAWMTQLGRLAGGRTADEDPRVGLTVEPEPAAASLGDLSQSRTGSAR